jgi:AcrR family transcriptional regulator
MALVKTDRRRVRTRAALLEAFAGLVTTRRYGEIRVGDVLSRAGVGRSTFYEHYHGMDSLLRESISQPFSVLAGVVTGDVDRACVQRVLEHFWENRRLARGLLRGSAAAHVARALQDLFEAKLAVAAGAPRGQALPARLVAAQLAAAQLGLLRAWIEEETRCGTAILAAALVDGTIALRDALLRGGSRAASEPTDGDQRGGGSPRHSWRSLSRPAT